MKSRIARRIVSHAVAFTLALSGALPAWAAPTGGNVVAGQATITQSGTATTINQSTDRAAINWQSFGIAASESVRFIQPSASSVALNRVLGQDASAILGSLSANGQVFLLNPNGVLFGAGAQVNVGGLVASSLGLTNENFMAGRYAFERAGAAGSVVNQGAIRADGGVVAFLAPQVRNEGTITANAGAVALAAAEKVTLTLEGNRFLGLTVARGALAALAENKGAIKADGGQVLLTAKAADALVKSVVNNEGTIEAQTLANVGGRIVLMAEGGETRVVGRLDASAPAGGDGGFIETSGDKVTIAPGATITTAAPQGHTGTWLVDPTDFTIAATGGDIDGATLGTQLGSNNVTLATSAAGAGNGDIFVNDTVTWANANTLTLSAHRNVDFSGGGTLNGGTTGNVTLNAGLNGTSGAIIGHATNTVFTGNMLVANARTGIGSSATSLRTLAVSAALDNTQSGGIYATNTGDVTVAAASTAGDVVIKTANSAIGSATGGNITVGTVGALNGITTTGSGNITLAAGIGSTSRVGTDGGGITLNAALNAAGNATLTAGSGGAGFDDSSAGAGGAGGAIALNAGGTIRAQNVTLTAGNGGDLLTSGDGGLSGGGGAITLNAGIIATQSATLTAGSSGSGGNFSGDSGAITVNALLSAQNVALTAGNGSGSSFGGTSGASGGAINLNAVIAATQNVTLTAGNGGNFMSGGAGGAINLNAGGGASAGTDVIITAGNGGMSVNGNVGGSGGGIVFSGGTISSAATATLHAGNGGNSTRGGLGGAGGSITLATGAFGAVPVVSVVAGNGGNGGELNLGVVGNGGTGGAIIVASALTTSGASSFTAGSGGSGGTADFGGIPSGNGGNGGAITLNAALNGSNLTLNGGTAGVAGIGNSGSPSGTAGAAGSINGSNVDVIAAQNLAVNGGIAATSGNVSLRAGMNAGNTLTLNAVSVANAATDNLTLQGHSATLGGSYAANRLEIATAGNIGSAGTPLATQASRLALQGSDVFVTNGRPVTLEASSATGSLLLNNGGNDITVAGPVSAQGAGDAIRLAGKDFINNAGSSALAAPNGRWIVWSQAPASNTFGGLQSGNTALWNTAFNAASPTVAQSGNRFAFSTAQPAGQAIVKADDKSKTYGDLFTGFTFTAADASAGSTFGNAFTDLGGTPTLVGTPALTSAGAAATATRTGGNAGGASYDITVDLTGVTAAGYTLQGVNGFLTINPRNVSVAAEAKSLVYGDAPQALTYTATNLASFDTNASAFTGAISRPTGATSGAGHEAAGTTAIGQGTLAANANYTLAGFTGSNYTIAPRALAVTATAQDKVYDGGVAAAATLADNRLAGDVFTASGTAAFADKNVAAGKTVTVSGIGLSGADAGNYAANAGTTTTATITQRALNIGFTGVDKTYDASIAATVAAADDRVAGDVLEINRSAAFANADAAPAKPITVGGVNLAGADAGNYSLGGFNTTTSATIAPRPLTITALDAAKLTTDPMPPFAARLSGFAPGEGVGSLTGLLTLTTPASASSPVGSYAIVPSGLSGSNYAIAYVNGKLTVVSPNDPQLQGALSSIFAGLGGTGAGGAPVVSGTGGTFILGGGMISIVTGDSDDE